MISDNRMFMWDVGTETTRDKTGLYLSYIDSQNYSSVTQENIGTGNGVLTSFSDTLINASSVVNVLGVNVYAPIGTPKTVSDVTRSATPTVTATAHGLAVGDYVFFYNLNASNPGTGTITTTGNQTVSGAGTAFTTQLKAGNTITIGGDTRTIQSITDDITLTVTANFPAHAASAFTYSNMSQLNYKYARVISVPNANSFTIDINTTSYTIYSSGATVAKAEVFTDDYNGNLVGNTTGTGTINYRTGAITVALPSAAVNGQPVLADYQYENSTAGGLADFTYSATRLAGEGDVFRQDEGGDAIQKVENFNGTYYSLKERSAYAVTLTNDDTNATNIIYRRNMGMPYFAASVSTVNGIVFLNTANPDQPQLTILKPNPLGNGIVPDELAPQFDFSLYTWDECWMDAWGDYIVFTGKTLDSAVNNRLFLYSLKWTSIDVFAFSASTLAKAAGLLYLGDSISNNIYNAFSGFDDDEFIIENYWISGDDALDSEDEKRVRRLALEGYISKEQSCEVYLSLDNDPFALLGTISGTDSFVDASSSRTVGSTMIGVDEIAGGGDGADTYHYFTELKINTGKFYRRRLKFKAAGIGYLSISMIKDKDIIGYGDRIPKKYRTN